MAAAGVLKEGKRVLALCEEAMAIEDRNPKKAVGLYRKAYDEAEKAGAVAGATGHALFPMRTSILQCLGELQARGVEI